MLGTNGGGFFNANSAHPFENPTPVTNMMQMWLIFMLPAGLTYAFGKSVRDTRQGWSLFAALSVLFLAGVFIVYGAEQADNPGAVNGMHDSLTPIGGLVPLFNMEVGEVIFGGVGSGLYGMLLFAILAVFIAGLMVGRTPEYLGKKIEGKEVNMAMIPMIAPAAVVLVFSAITTGANFTKGGYWNGSNGPATSNLNNSGPHGFSEILYAYSSSAANNGSAFAGINANTPWYNLTLGIAMLVGRFFIIIPMLAVAGNLAAKKQLAVTSGTLPTHGPLFVGLLVGTVIIVGALTFFPALSLSPIVEHLLMQQGRLF